MSFSAITDSSMKKRWLGFIEFTYSPFLSGPEFSIESISSVNYYKIWLPEIFEISTLDQYTDYTSSPDTTISMTEVSSLPADVDEFYRDGDYVYFDSNVGDRFYFYLVLRFTDGGDFLSYTNPADTTSDVAKYHSLCQSNISITIGNSSSVYGLATSSMSGLSIAITDDVKFLLGKEVNFYNKTIQVYMHVDETAEAERMFLGVCKNVTFNSLSIQFSVNDWFDRLDEDASWEMPDRFLYHEIDGSYCTAAYSNDIGKGRVFTFGRHSYCQLDHVYSSSRSHDSYFAIIEGTELYVMDYAVENVSTTSDNRNWGGIITFGDGGALFSSITTSTYSVTGAFDKRITVTDNRIFADGDIIRVTIGGTPYFDRVLKVPTSSTTFLHVQGGIDGVIAYPTSPTTFTTQIEELQIFIENTDGDFKQISPTYISTYYTDTITTSKGVDVGIYGVTFTSGLEASDGTFFAAGNLGPENYTVYARLRNDPDYYNVEECLERVLTQNSLTLDSTLKSTWESDLAGAKGLFQYKTDSIPTYKDIVQNILKSTYSIAWIKRGTSVSIGVQALFTVRSSSFDLYDRDISSWSFAYSGRDRIYRFLYSNKNIVDHGHNVGTKWGRANYTDTMWDHYLVSEAGNRSYPYEHILENMDAIGGYLGVIQGKRSLLFSFSVGNAGLNYEIGQTFTYKGSYLSQHEDSGRLFTIVEITYNKDKVDIVASDLYGNSGEDGI